MRQTHASAHMGDARQGQALRQYVLATEAATALSLATTIDELVAEAQRMFRRLYPDDHVWLCLIDADRLRMQRFLVGGQGVRVPGAIPVDSTGIVARVMRSGTPVMVDDVRRDGEYVALLPDMRSELAVPLRAGGELLGVLNLESAIVGRFTDVDRRITQGIGHHLAAAVAHLRDRRRLEQSLLDAISAMSAMVEGKDDYTEGHCQRIAEMSVSVGLRLGLDSAQIRDLTYAGLLHDIGKVAIPDAILLKPGPLDEDEWRIMQRHCTVGRQILEPLAPLRRVAEIVEQHHERFDGTGYPNGLKGEEIRLSARIIAVADAFDAMTSSRPYRKALPRREAIRRLRAGVGGQFDPEVVDVFCRYVLAIPSSSESSESTAALKGE